MFDNIEIFPLDRPAIRALEIMPVRTRQGEFLMVRDPVGLIEGAALLVPDPILLVFLQLADGNTSLGEMASKVTEATGQILPAGLFESLVKQLDEALLLQSERFVAALKDKYQKFMDSPTRAFRVFGVSQPGTDRLKMLKDLGDEFRRHKMSAISPPQTLDLPPSSVTAILAPHIDYQRGGEAYAWAYKALKDHGTAARTYIILGTCHRPTQNRFIATKKNYDTPFGLLETNGAMVDEIAAEYGGELFLDEYAHAEEHTIELNATYLRQTFQDRDIKIVPILVGSFEDYLMTDDAPAKDDDVQRFCAALKKIVEKYGDDVAIIGGVDFSHCGPEFGDEQLNEPARTKEIEEGDRRSIAAIEKADPEAFVEVFRPDQNERKVCSIGTMYCVLKAMQGKATPKLLAYQQANSTDKATLVSFAAFAFVKAGLEVKPKSKIILLS